MAAVQNGLTRVLSFGRRPKSKQAAPVTDENAANGATPRAGATPRFWSSTPRSGTITPRAKPEKRTQFTVELERDSKTDPLGLTFVDTPPELSIVGVIVTFVDGLAAAAGIRQGDVIYMVGSSIVESVDGMHAALKPIAGEVVLQVSRAKRLPAGWSAVTEGNRTVYYFATKDSVTRKPTKIRSEIHPYALTAEASRRLGVTPAMVNATPRAAAPLTNRSTPSKMDKLSTGHALAEIKRASTAAAEAAPAEPMVVATTAATPSDAEEPTVEATEADAVEDEETDKEADPVEAEPSVESPPPPAVEAEADAAEAEGVEDKGLLGGALEAVGGALASLLGRATERATPEADEAEEAAPVFLRPQRSTLAERDVGAEVDTDCHQVV
jgi:hypothetical protein